MAVLKFNKSSLVMVLSMTMVLGMMEMEPLVTLGLFDCFSLIGLVMLGFTEKLRGRDGSSLQAKPITDMTCLPRFLMDFGP